MAKKKVLNLYAGIGGNRKLWKDVEVTAVESDTEIAKIYQEHFPNDKVLIKNAIEELLNSDKTYDFIWASPPCQSHSHANNFLNAQGVKRLPDMELWGLIIYLRKFSKCAWVVENVKPYYDSLIEPSFIIGRHYFWSNFPVIDTGYKHSDFQTNNMGGNGIRRERKEYEQLLEKHVGFKIPKGRGFKHPTKLLTNAVVPEIGLSIFKAAFNQKKLEAYFT